MADQKVFSQIKDPEFKIENEAQALIDHFNSNIPVGGGEMVLVMRFFDARPWVHQNDYKIIFEMANKMNKDAKKNHQ